LEGNKKNRMREVGIFREEEGKGCMLRIEIMQNQMLRTRAN
jgi:hypothetical protein